MSNQEFSECNAALLSSCDLCFTFDKNKLFKAEKNVRINFDLWSRLATKNRNGKENRWNVNFPSRPVNENIHSTFTKEQLSSIYMIDDENLNDWENTGCLLIAHKGKELDVIKKLQIAGKFNSTKQFRIKSMSDWSVIRNNSAPCTDIILVDRYIFAQSDFEYNINSYALLEQLCKWANETTVKIVIFTLSRYLNNHHNKDIPFLKIKRNLKSRLKKIIGIEPCITFVILPKKEQHDRTIFTNYKMYTSGDSFKYFKDKENVSLCTHGEWMYISSLHDKDNHDNAKEFLNDLQTIVDNVKSRSDSVKGDKKSSYLHF